MPELKMAEPKAKEEPKKKDEYTNEDVEEIVSLLRIYIKKYEVRQGTYLGGYWKEKNENKVASAIKAMNSLIDYYIKYDSLTIPQILFAKKLIRNAAALK